MDQNILNDELMEEYKRKFFAKGAHEMVKFYNKESMINFIRRKYSIRINFKNNFRNIEIILIEFTRRKEKMENFWPMDKTLK